VSYKARQRAAAKGERLAREQGRARTRREWLSQENNPALAELLAALGSSVEALRRLAEKPEARHWGARRGPRHDPARILTHALVANAFENARLSGRSHEEAMAAGVTALRQSGSGASSPKTVEAIVTSVRKIPAPADIEADREKAKAVLREYGLRDILFRGARNY
jgi:hypothetical protein